MHGKSLMCHAKMATVGCQRMATVGCQSTECMACMIELPMHMCEVIVHSIGTATQ